MAFKPNYNHQRAERDRAKQLKKEAKLREKEERKRQGGVPAQSTEPEAEQAEASE